MTIKFEFCMEVMHKDCKYIRNDLQCPYFHGLCSNLVNKFCSKCHVLHKCEMRGLKPSSTELYYLIFFPLDVVFRYCYPQLQVGKIRYMFIIRMKTSTRQIYCSLFPQRFLFEEQIKGLLSLVR